MIKQCTIFQHDEPVKLEMKLYKDDPKVKAVALIVDETYVPVERFDLAYFGNGFHAAETLDLLPGKYVIHYGVVDDNSDLDGYEDVSERIQILEQPVVEIDPIVGIVENEQQTALIGVIE